MKLQILSDGQLAVRGPNSRVFSGARVFIPQTGGEVLCGKLLQENIPLASGERWNICLVAKGKNDH